MSLTDLIDHYGYVAVLLGAFIEGETMLILGGFAAHQGYLGFPGVVLAAFTGSVCGDQLAYFIGRRYGERVLQRFPRLRAGVESATARLGRHETPLLVGFRFLYGIRNVTPLAAGLARIPVHRFVLLNMIGASAWSVSVAAAGYAMGRGFITVVDRARKYEELAFAVILVAGAAWIGLRALARRRKHRAVHA